MADLYEAVFRWPHTDVTSVILTGTFDQWSTLTHLKKIPSGFEGTVKIPYEEKITYKFIVDGQWMVHEDQPTEADHDGNINNVFIAPKRPALPATLAPGVVESTTETANLVEPPAPAVANGPVPLSAPTVGEVSDIKGVQGTVVIPNSEAPTGALESTKTLDIPFVEGTKTTAKLLGNGTAAATEASAAPKGLTVETLGASFPQLVTDLADTIAAREGAISTLGYVASGLGAAIHGFVGVDPINADKIAYTSPVPDGQFEKPEVPIAEPEAPKEEPEVPAEEPEVPKGQEEAEVLREDPEVPAGEPEVPKGKEGAEVLSEDPEVPVDESEVPEEAPVVPNKVPEVQAEEPGLPKEESKVATEKPEALKEEHDSTEPPLVLSRDTVLISIVPVNGGSDDDISNSPPVLSVIDATSPALSEPPAQAVASIPVVPSTHTPVIIPFSEPPPIGSPESPAATVFAEQEAVAGSGETAMAPIQPDSPAIPPIVTEVDVLPEAEPTALSPAVPASESSPPASPECQPVAPALIPEIVASEPTVDPLVPTAAIGPEPITLADSATPNPNLVTNEGKASTHDQSECPVVPIDEPSDVPEDIVQSEPEPATSILAVPTSEPSPSVAHIPEPTAPTAAAQPDPITAADVMATEAKIPPSVTPASDIQPQVNVAQSEHPPVARTTTFEPEIVAAGDGLTPEAASPPPTASNLPAQVGSPPTTNGSMAADVVVSPEPLIKSPPVTNGSPAAPSTPVKTLSRLSTSTKRQEFPSFETPGSTPSSPSSSKVGTISARKKKSSIFGKLKHIFHKDEKEKGKS